VSCRLCTRLSTSFKLRERGGRSGELSPLPTAERDVGRQGRKGSAGHPVRGWRCSSAAFTAITASQRLRGIQYDVNISCGRAWGRALPCHEQQPYFTTATGVNGTELISQERCPSPSPRLFAVPPPPPLPSRKQEAKLGWWAGEVKLMPLKP